jgi:hypothetical protein
MAAAVLGGLIVSTILSLVVVPCFYVVTGNIRGKIFKDRPTVPTHSTAPLPRHSVIPPRSA